MTDNSFWDSAPDEPVARHGEFRLTVVHSPHPGPEGPLAAHDPVRAREFAAAFGTVDAVLGDLGTVPATDAIPLGTRSDLDLVRVGCWGGVTEIRDAALANIAGTFPVDEQADALARRLPGAVVVASVVVDHNSPYEAWKFVHPSGVNVFAAGWGGEADWTVLGDPAEVVTAFGIDPARLAERGVDPADEPGTLDWSGLARLALARVAPLDRRGLAASVFRVRHTEEATGDMEETWLQDLS
ncbi:DUF6333 family protein [Streptomyces sp. NPDC006743]|uniref:DUF6333 family protein n=1 Tax=Streptomyces sp. NPDC006743 TaxID=3154480 RepID=UPI003451EA71